MANVYRIWIVDTTGGNGREEVIITDTMQNAMSIAKAHCKWNEEVDSVDTTARDVTIDQAAIKKED